MRRSIKERVNSLETRLDNMSWIQNRILDTLNMRLEQKPPIFMTDEHEYLILVDKDTGEEIKFGKEKK